MPSEAPQLDQASQLSLDKAREELIRLKQRQAQLLFEKEQIIRSNRIQFFRPNSPKQHAFFEHADKRRRGIFAGNRFGKSTLGVVEDLSWALGFRPWYPKGSPLRTLGIPQERGIRGLVIAQDWDRVRELFTDDSSKENPGKFFEWAPRSSIVNTHRRQNGVIDQIFFESVTDAGRPRSSVIMFDTVKSFKQDGLSQESLDWDFVHFDEPCPRDLYTAVTRGLIDRGGYAWMLLTPLREIWMYNFMLTGAQDNPDLFWHEIADMSENPSLSQEERELFEAGLSEAERNCRIRGIPLAYGNLVYPSFDDRPTTADDEVRDTVLRLAAELTAARASGETEKEAAIFKSLDDLRPSVTARNAFTQAAYGKPYRFGGHILEKVPSDWASPIDPPRSWNILVSIDPHPQTPHAVLFTAISEEYVVFYDEIFEKCFIDQLIEKILGKIAGKNVQAVIMDPIAWQKNPIDGSCWADMFYEAGLDVIPASKAKTAGIIQAATVWEPTYHKRVLVMNHMRHFRREITNYFFDDDDKPVDKDDHLMECFYRTVMHDNFSYYPEYTASTSSYFFGSGDLSVSFEENAQATLNV